MLIRKSRWTWLLALVAVFSLFAAACGDDDDDGGGGAAAGDGGEAVSGEIVISGSSTVEPVSSLVAESFAGTNPDVAVSVDGPGTGDGFELFCNGETDISDASRPIEQEEIDACAANGVEFIELRIGIDGLTVLTSPANEAVECLDNAALYALVGPESEGLGNWSDAADLATELESGYVDQFPDGPLDITAPGEESGTYDSFVEIALEGIAEERGQEPVTRPDYTSSANDNAIIEGITGSDTSFGWVGYAFYVNNQDAVRAIPIDDGEGNCVEPTPETIASAEFPLSRDLLIYVNAANAEENAALASFVDFYLSEEGRVAVPDAGYVELTEDDLQATVDNWESRTTGTQVEAE